MIPLSLRRFGDVCRLLLATAAASASAGEFADLSRYLPQDANAVVVVNAATMYDSPLGKQENWRQRFADASQSTPLMLPPSAEHCVLAAKLDVESLERDWEAAIMRLSIDPSIADVAQHRGGRLDTIGGLPATWIPPNNCVVKFASGLFGLLSQADRQEAIRWVREATAANAQPLSPYLTQSIGYADSVGTQLILAVDLAGAFRTDAVRAAVARSKALDDLPEDQAAALMVGLQGVKLGVVVTDKLTGKLQFDFADDAALLAPVAKPLMLSILANSGAMLDEFNQWTAETKGASISLHGELSATGLRRLLSLLTLNAAEVENTDASVPPPPTPPSPPSAAPGQAPRDPADLTKQATQRYFRGVSQYIDDIQRINRAGSLQQAAMWLENYARRINALSTRNVDPEIVKYGGYVAQTLRSVVDQAYGVADKVAQADAGPSPSSFRIGYLPTARTINWGGYRMREYAPFGYADFDAQADNEARQRTQDEIYQSVQQAQQTLTQLVADHEQVRQKLTARYGVQF
jgi:hypothetical protein